MVICDVIVGCMVQELLGHLRLAELLLGLFGFLYLLHENNQQAEQFNKQFQYFYIKSINQLNLNKTRFICNNLKELNHFE